MSALLPLIKSHRAMAAALQGQVEGCPRPGGMISTTESVLERLCWAHQSAADDLERQMREALDRERALDESLKAAL